MTRIQPSVAVLTSRFRTRVRMVLACAVIATGIVACGGGGSIATAGVQLTNTPSAEGAPALPALPVAPTLPPPTPTPTANQLILGEYLGSMQSLYDEYVAAFTKGINIAQDGRPTSAQLPDFSAAVQKIKQAGANVRGLKPPPCLASAHQSLTAAILQIDDAFDRAQRGMRSNDSNLILSGANILSTAAGDVQKFNATLKSVDIKGCF